MLKPVEALAFTPTELPAADELVPGIADARTVVLREAGHFLWIDQQQAFAAEVAAFLLQ